MAIKVYQIVFSGLRLLASWKELVLAQAAYKYSKPAPTQSLPDSAKLEDPGIEYERVVRYNYTKAELNVLIDVVSLIKSLSGALMRAEHTLAPIIRVKIHGDIQDFVQITLLDMIHKADKKKRPVKDTLLLLRSIIADWANGVEPFEDYKQKPGKGRTLPPISARRRHSPTQQLRYFRLLLQSLYDERSSGMKSKGLFGSKDFSSSDVDTLETFHRASLFYPYLLDLSGSVRTVSDLGDLWYREFYLEMCKCVQFPIEMSLPWLLIKEMIENPSGPGYREYSLRTRYLQ